MGTLHLDILGLVFFTALFLSLFLVPATIVLANKVGAVDVPKGRSSHSTPTTRLGGLGIAASLALSCLMFLPLNAFSWAFLVGLLVTIVTGFVDDVVDIGPRWKFVGQIVAATSFVFLGGGALVNLGDFLGVGEITLDWLGLPFTIFCLVGGMNAFNLSDGLDGLAGGVTAIAAMFFAYFAWNVGATDLLLICVALLGAVMGFLRYNSHPAKLFMGDSGSLTLGYVLAAVLVSGSQREGHAVPLVIWAMVIALPLLDTLLVMARRVWNGSGPFKPDRTHLHHRLMALGVAHSGVVAVMYVVMACFGGLALLLMGLSDGIVFAALWLVGAMLFGTISALQHMGVVFNAGGRRRRKMGAIRQYPWFLWFARRVISVAVTVSLGLLFLLCLPAAFFPMPELNRKEVLALVILAGVVLFYGVHRTRANEGMLHGAVYVSIFVLFFFYNLPVVAVGSWTSNYLTVISILAAVWVAVKIAFRRNTGVLRASGFELLMVLLSWFFPFVLFEGLRLPLNVIEAGRIACLQVVPFMLAAKIYFNLQPQGNRWVVGLLVGTMMVIAFRGMLA